MEEIMRAELLIEAHDQLGEGPVWDARVNRVLWGDHHHGVVHEARLNERKWEETRRWNLNRPIAATIPRASSGLVIAAGLGILFLDDEGQLDPFASIPADDGRVCINDAKCDARGRLWVGTRSLNFAEGEGALYCIEPGGNIRTVLTGTTLSNGLGWSPDTRTFYFVDSLTKRVDAFDFELDEGVLSNRRVFAHVERGIPNGLAVDDKGDVWVASTGSGEVQCYSSQTGRVLARVNIETPGATSCAFGGDDGGILFITSRSGRMPDVARDAGVPDHMMDNNGRGAGALYACRVGTSAKPSSPFLT